MKHILVAVLTLALSGCYSNWPSLDKASENIDCDMDTVALGKIAKRYKATGSFDEISDSYSIVKNDDAIGVAFNPKGQILTIAKTKSVIGLLGLTRKQGDVTIVKRCIKQ